MCRVSIGGPLWLNSLIETKPLLQPRRFEHSSTWSGILSADFRDCCLVIDCCLGTLKWPDKFQTFRAPWHHLQEHVDTSARAPLLLHIGEIRFECQWPESSVVGLSASSLESVRPSDGTAGDVSSAERSLIHRSTISRRLLNTSLLV